jgi:hypothetical protein
MNVDRALSQPPLPLLSTETTTSNSRSRTHRVDDPSTPYFGPMVEGVVGRPFALERYRVGAATS